MIEHGADIKSQLRFGVSKTYLVIAQLLQYNCYAKYKEGAATHRPLTKCVHARHTPQEGSKCMLVKASDTDILVIAISAMPTLQAIGLHQLWIVFGQGRNMRWIPVHELYRSVGHEKGRGVTFFHVFISCDVVSAFRGKGKNLHGRPDTCVLRLLMSLLDSASTYRL